MHERLRIGAGRNPRGHEYRHARELPPTARSLGAGARRAVPAHRDHRGLDGLGSRAGSLAATILAGDIAPLEPQRGDEVRIDTAVHRVEDAERDTLGLSWRLILAEE